MKIVYFGNVKDLANPSLDKEILKGLKKIEKKVKFFDIKKFDMKKLISACQEADLFLFHGQIPQVDEVSFLLMMERIKIVLNAVKGKKVLWFLQKVWLDKIRIIENLLPYVDYAFFTDETWVRRQKDRDKIYWLHPAAPVKQLKGRFKPELECDIAYVGNIYMTREQEYEELKNKFGNRIKFFNDKYEQDLADLCASAKIMLIPIFPFDDFYWSERIYTYMAYGGLVVCQRTYGLKEDGFKEGEHYFSFYHDSEFTGLIKSLLESKEKFRKYIAKKGREFVKKKTWADRLKKMLAIIEKNESIISFD